MDLHGRHRVLGRGRARRESAPPPIGASIAAGRPPSGQRPGEGEVLARRPDGSEILRYQSVSVRDTASGDIEELSLWAGQGVGLVREVLPAAEIVRRTVEEAEAALSGAGRVTAT
jgi:NAD(P)H-dependent flavin oxidoreductase YrpB (nitropropane dioxygenase family)